MDATRMSRTRTSRDTPTRAGHAAMNFDEVLRMLVSSPDHFGGWSLVGTWTQRARTSVVF
jgi:hypothetical protein